MRNTTEIFERSDGTVRVVFYEGEDGFYSCEEERADVEELPGITDEIYHLWIPVHNAGLFASAEERRHDALLRYNWLKMN